MNITAVTVNPNSENIEFKHEHYLSCGRNSMMKKKIRCLGFILLILFLIASIAQNIWYYSSPYFRAESYLQSTDEIYTMESGILYNNLELKAEEDIEIKYEDIRVDTYRSSGAGGQHINKTSSAIRITHFPTGIVVTCQNERSQHMNKDKAMEMLRAKLELLREQEQEQRDADIRGDVSSISWGNQIRSYVFQPYTMVKDLRTGEETSNVDGVMDGDLDPFMNSYLKWVSLGKPKRGVVDAD